MNHETPQLQLDLIFHALASGVRRNIIEHLLDKPMNIMELAKPEKVSFQAVSKHIVILEKAGFVSKIQNGRKYQVRIQMDNFKKIEDLIKYYKAFWDRQLSALDDFLNLKKKNKEKK